MTSVTATLADSSARTKDEAAATKTLRIQTARHFAVASLVLSGLVAGLLFQLSNWTPDVPTVGMILTALGLWSVILHLTWRGLDRHPHQSFGPANVVTLYRAAGTVLIASLVPVAGLLSDPWLWFVTVLAILLLSLDGIDGYLARRTRLASNFGARFDMEIDALLILTISVFLWQSGEVGVWIISLGLMRYLFVLAGFWSPPLRSELFPSFRRKTVCVIQLVTLCAMLSPLLSSPLSVLLGVIALICLAGSFLRDILWLYQHQSFDGSSAVHKAPGTVASIDVSP